MGVDEAEASAEKKKFRHVQAPVPMDGYPRPCLQPSSDKPQKIKTLSESAGKSSVIYL